jgi:hypothetical protein
MRFSFKNEDLSKGSEWTVSDVFLPGESIPGAGSSLECEDSFFLDNSYFCQIYKIEKLTENEKVSHFGLYLAPGVGFLWRSASGVVCLKMFERSLFFVYFLTKSNITYFRRK